MHRAGQFSAVAAKPLSTKKPIFSPLKVQLLLHSRSTCSFALCSRYIFLKVSIHLADLKVLVYSTDYTLHDGNIQQCDGMARHTCCWTKAVAFVDSLPVTVYASELLIHQVHAV